MTVNQRSIIRKLKITPRFYQVDMMGVVHNAEYFRWFEEGRLQIMTDIISIDQSASMGYAFPVIENTCRYLGFAGFGDSLIMTTIHKIESEYRGKLKFTHSIVNEKTRASIAEGETLITIIEYPSRKLVKEWPSEIWEKYQSLK
ncbi:MAG: acyl-CoA thioesterase [Fibrobacter sp.]|jgi:acyl-CoA thioester hydrolase|nr:acyl-CoA thioesterase [Fibrobacter sp.]